MPQDCHGGGGSHVPLSVTFSSASPCRMHPLLWLGCILWTCPPLPACFQLKNQPWSTSDFLPLCPGETGPTAQGPVLSRCAPYPERPLLCCSFICSISSANSLFFPDAPPAPQPSMVLPGAGGLPPGPLCSSHHPSRLSCGVFSS